MGCALGECGAGIGTEVVIVSRLVQMEMNQPNITRIKVKSAAEMAKAAEDHFTTANAAILCAAVADFTPVETADVKMKRGDEDLVLRLKPTQDIAKRLGELKKDGQIWVGFALETKNEEDNDKGKLERKNLDFIVLNSVNDAGAGFRHDTNKIAIIDKNTKVDYPLKPKTEVASDIIDHLVKMML